MTLQEIKSAVDKGIKVFWSHEGYEVRKDTKIADKYHIVYYGSDKGITGLCSESGVLNGEESDFYTESQDFELTKVSRDKNGNPRYVCHFLNLVNDKDRENAEKFNPNHYLVELYKIACKKGNSIGGKKYRAKHYGGGIVFQSYNTDDLKKHIRKLKLK